MCVGTQVGLGRAVIGGVIGDTGTGVGAVCPAAELGFADLTGAALDCTDDPELDRGVDSDTSDAFTVCVQLASTTTSTGRSANLAPVEKECRNAYPLRRAIRFAMKRT